MYQGQATLVRRNPQIKWVFWGLGGGLLLLTVVAVILLLLYEHSLVRPNDLSKLNAAFFTMNGVISVLFFMFVAGDLLLRK